MKLITETIKPTNNNFMMNMIQEEEEEEDRVSSSSSSSIGKNSDDDNDEDQDHASDAESTYRYDHDHNDSSNNNNMMRNGSIDDAIQAIEEALPIRRGISTFYNGKSKSFTCLADVWTSSTPSIKDIAKPENAYSRKRKNLLASTLLSSKNKKSAFQLSSINTGRISKKPKATTPRFALESNEDPKPLLLTKQNMSSMRSFSMVNLNVCSSRFGLNSTGIENC